MLLTCRNMIVYAENLKESAKEFLRTNKFSKVTRCKINIKRTIFLYTRDEVVKIKIKMQYRV